MPSVHFTRHGWRGKDGEQRCICVGTQETFLIHRRPRTAAMHPNILALTSRIDVTVGVRRCLRCARAKAIGNGVAHLCSAHSS